VISFRYHVVSIVAVFLALALGVVVGTTALNGPITTNLRQQVDSLKSDRSSLASTNKTLQQQAGNAAQFAQTFGARIVAGTLKGKNVVIIGMPGASASVKNAISKQIGAAGGTVSGNIQFTSDYVDPRSASDITNLVESVRPISLTNLPTSGDAGTLGGALFGYVLLNSNAETTDISTVIAGFTKAQLLTVETQSVGPADLAVIVTSGTMTAQSDSGKAELETVTQFQLAGGHTVVAGDSPSDTGGGLVALVRSSEAVKDTVSTVDDADTSMGQVTTTLALAEAISGKTGAYGNGSGSSSLFPSLPK
jgi:hypothetical protein